MREEMKFEKPKNPSEANAQAEFYHQCKIRGINCYLEYKKDHKNSRIRGRSIYYYK